MIERMFKAYCVSRARDRDSLLTAIRELGVVHLEPVDPAKAVADEKTTAARERIERALQLLAVVAPAGEAPSLTPDAAADEALAIERRTAERQSRLTALRRQVRDLAMWGDCRVEDLVRLGEAGIDVRFFLVAAADTGAIEAECVEVVGAAPGGRVVTAVVNRAGAPKLPEGSEEVPPPKTDRPSIRAEAAEIDAALKQDQERLQQLARLVPQLGARRAELAERTAYSVAAGGALAGEDLVAVQGWVPVKTAGGLAAGLAAAGVDAAVQTLPPAEDEAPPTLVSYPGWARPIKGLFEILGTVPGYREIDLSAFFMLAMPMFAAILIGDAGYGLVFLLAGLLFYKKAVAAAGPAKIHLLLIIGLVTFIWGVLTGGFFGLGPLDFCKAGGFWNELGTAWNRICFVGADTASLTAAVHGGKTEAIEALNQANMADLRLKLMQVSFIIAVIHLVSARLREALGLAPDQRALASVGWAVLLGGMFGLVWFLFFTSQQAGGGTLSPVFLGLLLVGFALAVLFSAPSANPVKRLAVGLAACLLPAMSTFSDTMSYIRLMAVSMASVYIAQVFNMLGSQLAEVATWGAGGLVVVFGHALNIGLCAIAIFAHGVRLNMLEFSNNAGVQWGGYPFAPFAKTTIKES